MSALLFQITTFFWSRAWSHGWAARRSRATARRCGSKLLQYPITFAFGSAVITMVATAVGARDYRARPPCGLDRRGGGIDNRTRSFMVFRMGAATGWRLFSKDPEVRARARSISSARRWCFPSPVRRWLAYFATVGLGSRDLLFLVLLHPPSLSRLPAAGWRSKWATARSACSAVSSNRLRLLFPRLDGFPCCACCLAGFQENNLAPWGCGGNPESNAIKALCHRHRRVSQDFVCAHRRHLFQGAAPPATLRHSVLKGNDVRSRGRTSPEPR